MKATTHNVEELAESFINGNIDYCKKKVKQMDKYTFLQFVWALGSCYYCKMD